MFLTENYVCFYSNVLGMNRKIIPLKEITSIRKKNSLGLFPNAIKFVVQDGQTFFFCSFANRNIAYDMLTALWKNNSQGYTEIEDIESEEEEEEMPSLLGEEKKVQETHEVQIEPLMELGPREAS